MLRQEILDSSQKYDEIVREWNKKKPKYDKMIKDYTEKIANLKVQIEQVIIERINDREHAKVYNSMIEKREAEIAELTQKIEDCRKFDELSKKRRDELMSTAELLDEVLLEPYMSDMNDEYNTAKEGNWKCFSTTEGFDIDQFIIALGGK